MQCTIVTQRLRYSGNLNISGILKVNNFLIYVTPWVPSFHNNVSKGPEFLPQTQIF